MNFMTRDTHQGSDGSKSCNACSMKDICLPKLGKASSVRDYIRGKIEEDV